MSDKKIRIIGIFLLISSLILAYFSAYLPVQAAKNQEADVSLNIKLNFLTPFAFIFGAYCLAFGRKGREWMQSEENRKQRLKLAGWLLMAVGIGASIGYSEWLKATISAYGYQF